jgi:transposase
MSETYSEIAVLRAALAASEARASAAEGALLAATSELAQVQAVVSASEDMIRHLRLQIAKLRREQFGHSAERHARLIEQPEMQLEDIETDIADDKAKAEATSPKMAVVAFERRRPARKPLPEHLPRERVVIEAPTSCTCCGSARIVKMGEDITETLEVIPRQWKVVQTVREKFTCRDCEKISQPPAPFHPTPRGWAQSAGNGFVREVWPAPTPEPAGRTLCQGRGRYQPFDVSRSGRSLRGRAAADP